MGTITLNLPISGTVVTAGLLANDLTTVQTLVNGNIDTNNVAPAAGIKGSQLATGISGPPGTELAYNEFTSNVSCTHTSEATADTIVTASAVTFDGATSVMVDFFAENYDAGDAPLFILYLYDGASSLGFLLARTVVTSAEMGAIRVARRLTPSAAAHTFSVRGSISAGAGVSVKAGAGGAGVAVPGYIRITKA